MRVGGCILRSELWKIDLPNVKAQIPEKVIVEV